MNAKKCSIIAVAVVLGAALLFPERSHACDPTVTIESWDSKSVASWSADGGGPTNVVLTTENEYKFTGSCDCDQNVTLTTNFGKSAGPANPATFNHSFSLGTDESETEDDKWVRVTCPNKSKTGYFTVITVSLDQFERMPPGPDVTYETGVDLSLALTDGRQVDLEVIKIQGDGSATIDPASVTAAENTVELTGTAQTGMGDEKNMLLEAQVTGGVPATGTLFSICAHPDEFEYLGDAEPDAGWYGLDAGVGWKSDSLRVEHLDWCYLSEVLTPLEKDEPPFYCGDPDPFTPWKMHETEYAANFCSMMDMIRVWHEHVHDYKDGWFKDIQSLRWQCYRCCSEQTVVSTNICSHHVTPGEGEGEWKIVTKVSGSATGLPRERYQDLPPE